MQHKRSASPGDAGLVVENQRRLSPAVPAEKGRKLATFSVAVNCALRRWRRFSKQMDTHEKHCRPERSEGITDYFPSAQKGFEIPSKDSGQALCFAQDDNRLIGVEITRALPL
jgi:hypothetical protein